MITFFSYCRYKLFLLIGFRDFPATERTKKPHQTQVSLKFFHLSNGQSCTLSRGDLF